MKSFWIHLANITFLSTTIISCQKETANSELLETDPPVFKANFIQVSELSMGFYSAVPVHYNQNLQKYPLLIWIHGNGQVGNGNADLPKVLYGGIPKMLDEKKFPPSFKVNGHNFSFIILAPQFEFWPGSKDIISFIDYAKKNYRIDGSRIYLAGISMGGIVTADFGAENPEMIAAIIPIAGVSLDNVTAKCAEISAAHLPVWVFQNDEDEIFNAGNSRNFIATIKTFKNPILPRYTEFQPFGNDAHDAWTMATNPDYREQNMNMYEWMLQYTR